MGSIWAALINWLVESNWEKCWERELLRYDEPNPFGYRAPIYGKGRRVWKRVGSRITWLVGYLALFLSLAFILGALIWGDLYENWAIRYLGEARVNGFFLGWVVVDLLLIVLFLCLYIRDGIGETRWYPPDD